MSFLTPSPSVAARLFICAAAATIAACGSGGGSGGGSPPPPPSATTLSGTVASGAPLAGATVTVIDSDAGTANPAPVNTAADGSYSIDVSSQKAPLAVKVTAIISGAPVDLVAVVPSVTSGTSNTANVTPLTHAAASLIAPGGDPLALLAPAVLASNVTTQKVSDAAALIVNTLATEPAFAAALGANFNPLTTPFTANGSGIDGVLDRIDVQTSSAGVTITNLAAAVGGSAAPAPVVLTAAMTSTPTVVPTLPASSSDPLPTATELAALGKKFQDCLALPVAQRVTLDAQGNVTAVLAPCNYAPADWKSNGRTWAQEVGQFTFAKDILTNAKVDGGRIVLTLAPAGLTDPKEFKHPYCNTATCVVVRYSATLPNGRASASDWVLAKVNGAWDFIGNHRPYRLFVEPRLNRKIAVNTAGPAPGNTTNPYFFADRYESVLRLIFDPSVGDTSNVRAVRVTGPGLPTPGVVLFRSQRCGSDDRMGIRYQSGSTRVLGSTSFQFWTDSAAVEFVLDAANLDGTALQMPPSDVVTGAFPEFSPDPIADQSTLIPAWTVYKFEVFHFDVLSDTPDEIIYARTSFPSENAALGATKAWPTLAPSFVDAYLTPTGNSAGTISSLAQTMTWTAPTGGYVGSSYLFSQNFLLATNAENETASYGKRTRLDFEPAALGDTTANGIAFASFASGTSLSPFTQSIGTNPNPRCTSPDLVPLTTSTSDYREAGLTFRGADRKVYNAIWFWDR